MSTAKTLSVPDGTSGNERLSASSPPPPRPLPSPSANERSKSAAPRPSLARTAKSKQTKSCTSLNEAYDNFRWPLPKMFGEETYAYTEIEIHDPRYSDELKQMNRDLKDALEKEQMVEKQWRMCYAGLTKAEHRRKTLSASAPDKTKSKFDRVVEEFRVQLVKLQEDRDKCKQYIAEIYARIDVINKEINKEKALEDMQRECAEKLMQKSGGQHIQQPFRVGQHSLYLGETLKKHGHLAPGGPTKLSAGDTREVDDEEAYDALGDLPSPEELSKSSGQRQLV